MTVNLQFGKFKANDLYEANLTIKNGSININKCGSLKIISDYSIYELGVVATMMGSTSYDGFKIGDIGSADLKTNFSNMDIGNIKKSFTSENFSYASLKIGNVAETFAEIKLKANFASVQIALTEKHNFKTSLNNDFCNIKTGNVIFYEKSVDKNDVIIGIAGKLKEPTSTVEISNSHGKIVFE